MDKASKIYIAGHTGLFGGATLRLLRDEGYKNFVLRTHSELDLTRQAEVEKFFAEEKPEYERLEALIQYDTYGCKTSEDLRKAQMAFNELFYYQMNRIGREEFCSRVYAYLIQSERKLQPIDFLYRMEE